MTSAVAVPEKTESRVIKLINTAGHPGTNDSEALNAIRAAYRIAEGQGFTLSTLFEREPKNEAAPVVTFVPYPDLRDRILKLEAEVDDLHATVRSLTTEKATILREKDRLERELRVAEDIQTRLKARVEKTVKAVDGHVTFAQFRRAVVDRIGQDKSWQTIFCTQTDTHLAKLQIWRRTDRVPMEDFEKTATLVPPGPETRHTWTPDNYTRVESLCAAGKSDPEIATILSNEIGRTITTNAIKGAKSRLRHGKV